MLLHPQQINHRWHQHDPATDTQQSHEHAYTQSKQQGKQHHRRILPAVTCSRATFQLICILEIIFSCRTVVRNICC